MVDTTTTELKTEQTGIRSEIWMDHFFSCHCDQEKRINTILVAGTRSIPVRVSRDIPLLFHLNSYTYREGLRQLATDAWLSLLFTEQLARVSPRA